jgi:hypothetical protein
MILQFKYQVAALILLHQCTFPLMNEIYIYWSRRLPWSDTATQLHSSSLLYRRQHRELRLMIPNRFTNLTNQDTIALTGVLKIINTGAMT